MIITSDLRAAIRSAYQAQKKSATSYSEHSERIGKAISDFLKKNTRVTELARRLSGLDRLRSEIVNDIACYGISSDLRYINNPEAFAKHGGVPPPERGHHWSFDAVMAELAKASPKEGKKILKKYGINWS